MSINKMPEVLNDFRVYNESSNILLGIATLELPEFSSITQTIKGIGVGGEIDAPVLGQFESMETKINWNVTNTANLKMIGGQAVALEARAAVQNWDSGDNSYAMDIVRVIIRGRSKSANAGKWEPANTTDSDNTIETTYVKYEVNDKTILEVDKYAYKFVTDGVDIMTPIRTALGL